MKISLSSQIKLYFTLIICFYISISKSQTILSDKLDVWIHYQKQKPGEDGYVTIVHPQNGNQSIDGYRFFHVNGILNSYKDGIENARLLANRIGQPIVFIYSESLINKGYNEKISKIGDSFKAIAFKLGAGSEAITALGSVVFTELLEGKKVLILPHSRGAAVTYNAMDDVYNHLTRTQKMHLLSELKIITLGGFSPSSENWKKGFQVYDIENQFDVVPLLAGRGSDEVDIFNLMDFEDSHPLKEYLARLKELGLENLNGEEEENINVELDISKGYEEAQHNIIVMDEIEVLGYLKNNISSYYECVDCTDKYSKPGTYTQQNDFNTNTTIISPIKIEKVGGQVKVKSSMEQKVSGYEMGGYSYSPVHFINHFEGDGVLNGNEVIIAISTTTEKILDYKVKRIKPYSNDPSLRKFEKQMDESVIGTYDNLRSMNLPEPELMKIKLIFLPDGKIKQINLNGMLQGKELILDKLK